ncbi:uncharacterized protein LOC123508322 [Portunus trituberculatus]|uniref:uncharacterized protein LOC123508322 n=1 Tax=Portunus trituberculatus TaxID=210409 RepID=UPI001E1CB4A6|nr:uncharacterized protein LOC123508322 [Portunus trituberculatus]
MPLTLTYVLLGVSCACILFEKFRVSAESDKLQLGQDQELSGLPEKPTGVQTRRKPFRRESYQFPIVEKGGVPYYDLGGINDTTLDIFRNKQRVKGITATHGNCKIQLLYLDTHYLLDEELITNCPNISLRLKGERWRCLQDGLMLLRRGVEVNMTEAFCMDAWLDEPPPGKPRVIAHKYPMAKGLQKFMEFDIDNCSVKMCICRWYFKEDSYALNVDCDGVGLTDDMLPTLPDKVRKLMLRNNKLRSMETLIERLLPHHLTLQVVILDGNFIEELPHFPNGTFPKIINLSLNWNKIEEIDIKVFKELITRKELIISLTGNTFPCDCNLYNFKVFLEENYLRHWSSFKTIMYMECKYRDQDKKVKIYTLPEELCKTWLDGWKPEYWWWVINFTLGVLNMIVIILMVDIICIWKHVGCMSERVPLMGRLMCLFGLAHHKLVTNENTNNRQMVTFRSDSF